jgi:lipopolysaccharide export system protein LptA
MTDLMKMGRLAAGLAVMASVCASGALAQQKASSQPPQPAPQNSTQAFRLDPNEPVDLKSDGSETQNGGCTLVLTGHVQVTQKQARLVGHSAIAVMPKKGDGCGDLAKVDVDKDVYYVTPDATVRADHALYDLETDKVTFTGSVVLVRCADVGTGNKLVMDMKTNDYALDGPVHAVIMPTAKPADGSTPAPACPSATNSAQKPGKPGK